MKKTALLIAALLAGCATTKTYQASPQQYRAKGQENQVQITGKVDQNHDYKITTGDIYTNRVTIYIDGKEYLSDTLDPHGSGEFTGQKYNDKLVTASCSSKHVAKGWVELKCIVFIDNERAATLIM